MSRPPQAPGTWGAVQTKVLATGRVQARGTYRRDNGEYRRLAASGATETEALQALARAGDGTPIGTRGAALLTRDSRISELSEYWLAKREVTGSLRRQTLQTYRRTVRADVIPTAGRLRIKEATTPVLEQALLAAAIRSRQKADRARTYLSMMFDEAARLGLVDTNPVTSTSRYRPPPAEVEALSAGDIRIIRRELATWEAATPAHGMRRSNVLSRFVDVMLGSGLRIGEVLALRACDLTPVTHDFVVDGEVVTVSGLDVFVGATIVYVEGEGHLRQETPKRSRQTRHIFVAGTAADALRSSIDPDAADTQTAFHSRNGTWLTPANVRRTWRKFLQSSGIDALLEATATDITPHTFRRTVATMIGDAAKNPKLASELLGHSNEAITQLRYIKHSGNVDPLSALILSQYMDD